jgi:hypothetical protein
MAEETKTPKKAKRLNKNMDLEKGVLTIEVIGGKKGVMTFDPKQIKDTKVQAYFPILALNHALGDAAAGRAGEDAEKAIQAKWEGYLKGDLTVRTPAQPKVAVNSVLENFSKLSPAEKKAAMPLLKALGITIPE